MLCDRGRILSLKNNTNMNIYIDPQNSHFTEIKSKLVPHLIIILDIGSRCSCFGKSLSYSRDDECFLTNYLFGLRYLLGSQIR